MANIENFGINRAVHQYEDEDENIFQIVTYVLAYVEDDEFIENEGEIFNFIISLRDNLLVENDDDLELDFIDVYEEVIYRFDELETLFENDVKEYGESLSINFNINEIKERCLNYIKNL